MTSRPNPTGQRDALGREIKVSNQTVAGRASAPPPPDSSTPVFDPSAAVGRKWWDAIPAGSVLVNPMLATGDDHVAVFQTPHGHQVVVSHWDDEVKKVSGSDSRGLAGGGDDDEPTWAGITLSFPNGQPDAYDPDDEECWFAGYSVSITTAAEDDFAHPETIGVSVVGIDPATGYLTGHLLDDDDQPTEDLVDIRLDTIDEIEIP